MPGDKSSCLFAFDLPLHFVVGLIILVSNQASFSLYSLYLEHFHFEHNL